MKHDYNLQSPVQVETTGNTGRFGFIQTHLFGGSGFVEQLVIKSSEGPNGDASVQAFVDQSALFSNPITTGASSGVPETFVPDQNRHFAGPSVEAMFSVITSASASASMVAGLLVDDRKG